MEALIASDYDTMMLSMFEEEILAKVTAFSLTVLDECEAELKKAIDDFISANAEKLDMTEEEILTEIGFLEEEESTDTSDTSDTSSDTSSDASSDTSSDTSEPADEPTEPEEPEDSDTDVTDHPYFRFVLEKKITEQFYAFNGDPNPDRRLICQSRISQQKREANRLLFYAQLPQYRCRTPVKLTRNEICVRINNVFPKYQDCHSLPPSNAAMTNFPFTAFSIF